MKKIFIIAILLISVFTAVILFGGDALVTVGEDGYAMPASSGVSQSLASGEEAAPFNLVEVRYEDVIYQKVTDYFVGESRTPIDITYPLYINGGVGLRFMTEENWLVTPDVDVVRTFEGLYVNEGVSFNSDMSRADDEEFIFLTLSNGLYMNVQQAVFKNRLVEVTIPANSIILFTETGPRWYAYNSGTMGGFSENGVFDATLTVGGYEYDYTALMKALGLVSQAIERQELGRPDEELLQEALDELEDNMKEIKDPAQGEEDADGTEGDLDGEEGGPGDETKPGDNEQQPGDGDQTGDNAGGGGAGGDNQGDGNNTKLTPATVPITASKLVDGKTPTENIYVFVLEDSNGREVERVTNQGGSISFTPLSFDRTGTYTYTLRELPGDNQLMQYDTGVYTITVKVTKTNTAYQAEVTTLLDGNPFPGAMVFRNVYYPDGTPIPSPGTGPGEDNGNKDPAVDPDDGDEGDNDNKDETKPDNTNTPKPVTTITPTPDVTPTPTPTPSGDAPENTPNTGGDGDNNNDGEQKEPVELKYVKPEVTISNYNAWCYAVDMNMNVYDPVGIITRGVKITAYSQIRGTSNGETYEKDGYKYYSQKDFEGKSLMARKTRTGTQNFSLNPLKPGQTVYIQFTYRYHVEEPETVEKTDENGDVVLDENGDPVMETVTVKKRAYFYSDYVEIQLPTVEESDVKAVAVDWETVFATHADAFTFQNMTVANTSAYDEELAAKKYDFANFKLDTLPYVNRMEVTLTPVGGVTPTVVSVGSSVLNRAISGPTRFASSSPKLESDQDYTVSVKLYDRYENVLPMVANGIDYKTYSQMVYTQKQQPVVTITEEANLMDSLTVRVHISDPDGALDSTKPLRFTMLTDNQPVVLYGHWGNGTAFGSEETREIELTNPRHNKEYVLQVESLAFARLFIAQAQGDYDPQPSAVDSPRLDIIENVVFGQLRAYTASLSDGVVNFISSFTDILDTSGTLNLTMTGKSTMEMLPLIDEVRISLTDPQGNRVPAANVTLKRADMETVEPVLTEGRIYLQQGGYTDGTVYLYGDSYQLGPTLWDSFCCYQWQEKDPDTDEWVYKTSTPLQLRIALPEDSLTNFTKYTLNVEAVVIKGGQEYYIPTSMSLKQFTTKKIIPTIVYDDLFVASDVAQFVNLRVLDPDATIQYSGKITTQLYYGNTLMGVNSIYADQSKDGSGDPVELSFSGLVEGGAYSLKFIADAYNDEEGYGAYRTNYVLSTYEIVGGSDLRGDLTLTGLTVAPTGDNLMSQATYYRDYMIWNGWKNTSLGYNLDATVDAGWRYYYPYTSALVPCEPNTTYVITYQPGNSTQSTNLYLGSMNTTMEEVSAVVAKTQEIEATGIKTWSLNEEVKKQGVGIHGDVGVTGPAAVGYREVRFTTGPTANYLVIGTQNDRTITNEDGKNVTVSSIDLMKEHMVVRKTGIGESVGPATATIDIDVIDVKGYLGREGESKSVTMTIESAPTLVNPSYSIYDTIVFDLEDGEGDSLVLQAQKVLENLPSMQSWRVTLSATYQTMDIQLDQIYFQSNGNYYTAATHQELYDILVKNPYANVLITSDFVQDYNANIDNVYGIIDFQGHTVTRSPDLVDKRMFTYVHQGAVIRNLVYQFPAVSVFQGNNNNCLIYTLRGTLEDVIIRTQGKTYVDQSLIILYIEQTGVLRNFIVRFADDVIFNSTTNTEHGAVVRVNQGRIENGYVYGVNGAGVIGIGDWRGALFDQQYYGGSMEHVYIIMDSWQRIGTDGQLNSNVRHAIGSTYAAGAWKNMYVVADYYGITDNGVKHWRSPLKSVRITSHGEDEAYLMDNVWMVTTNEIDTRKVPQASLDKLYDAQWQAQLLGSGFDVEGCVPMGFYPRLNMSNVMQKHQEYLSLPLRESTKVPEILDDGWATDYEDPKSESGYVLLRMKNDSVSRIAEVTIENLKTEVLDQYGGKDGIYNVILRVSVDPDKEAYLSKYNVQNIVYYSGTAKRSATSDYVTRNISFWKEIDTTEEWTAINSKMNWNYRITSDLDFVNVTTPGAISINGNLTNFTSTTQFTGKIDGQNHVLKNISMENLSHPYVIYAINSGGEVKNLLIEDMVITSSANPANDYCGFIGLLYYGTVENVHFRNSEIVGGARVGTLVGQTTSTYSLVDRCTITNGTLEDINTGRAVYAGGLIGYASGPIYNCYLYNMNINVTRSTVISGVGGLVGTRNNILSYENNFVHGSLVSAGSLTGGISGAGNSGYDLRSISYMSVLQTAGDNAGGFKGAESNHFRSVVALGNVSSAGEKVGRLTGTNSTSGTYNKIITTFAWEGQQVDNHTEIDTGNVSQLISGDDMTRLTTWTDYVLMGDGWDYSPLANNCLPIPAAEYAGGNKDWQPVLVPIPGLSGDPTLKLESARYLESSAYPYVVTLRLEHPAKTAAEMDEIFQNNRFTLTMDGMDLSTAAQSGTDPKTKITIQSYGTADSTEEERYSYIRIETKSFTKALDSYMLYLKYNDGTEREMQLMVSYTNPDGSTHLNWWEVHDLSSWNNVVREHGTTDENILITGVVDFKAAATSYVGLRFNRLSGNDKESNGFKNLKFVCNDDGEPWIDKIAFELTDLFFDNMYFDFGGATVTRARSGAILYARQTSDVNVSKLRIITATNTREYMAFLSTVTGDIINIHVENVKITCKEGDTTNGKTYMGGFVAYCEGMVKSVTGKNIIIHSPYSDQVGGLIGRQAVHYKSAQDVHVENVNIDGRNYVGGVYGYNNDAPINCTITGTADGTDWETDEPLTMNLVTGDNYIGGACGYHGHSHSTGNSFLVENLTITSTNGQAGGVGGGYSHAHMRDTTVRNCVITGVNHVAGVLAGRNNTTTDMQNIQVIGCTIVSDTKLTDSSNATNTSSGGVMATNIAASMAMRGIVVRDTTIIGSAYVGGIIGVLERTSTSTNVFERFYVAEDVVVKTKDGGYVAGGIIGWANRVVLTDSISGATVSSATHTAGGVIGQVEPASDVIMVELKRVISSAKVTAGTDYAAGLVGKVNTTAAEFTDDNLVNCMVTGTVNTKGTHKSLWMTNTGTNGGAGMGSVYIWEDAQLDYQPARALYEAYQNLGDPIYIVPNSTVASAKELLVTGAQFNNAKFYEKLEYSSDYWDLSRLGTEDNTYMPYTKHYNYVYPTPSATATPTPVPMPTPTLTNDVLYYACHDISGDAAGIPLPDAAEVTAQVLVYASGVNTINIEVVVEPEEDTTVTPTPEQTTDPNTPATVDDEQTTENGNGTGGTGTDTETNTNPTVTVNDQVISTNDQGIVTVYYNFTENITINGKEYKPSDLARKVMVNGNYWYYIGNDGMVYYGNAAGSASSMGQQSNLIGITSAVHLWQGKVLESDGMSRPINGTTLGSPHEVQDNGTIADTVPFWRDSRVDIYHQFTVINSGNVVLPYRLYLVGGEPYTVSPDQNAVYDSLITALLPTSTDEFAGYFATLSGGKLYAWQNSLNLGDNKNEGIHHTSNNWNYNGSLLMICYEDGTIVGVDFTKGTTVCSNIVEEEATSFAAYAMRSLRTMFSSNGGQTIVEGDEDYRKAEELQQKQEEFLPEETLQTGSAGSTGNAPQGTIGQPGEILDDVVDEGGRGGTGQSTEGSEALGTGGVYGTGGDGSQGSQSSDAEDDSDGETNGNTDKTGANGPGGDGGTGGTYVDGDGSGAYGAGALGRSMLVYDATSGKYVAMETASLLAGEAVTLEEAVERETGKTWEELEPELDAAEDAESPKGLSIFYGLGRDMFTREKQGFTLIASAALAAGVLLVLIGTKLMRKRK